LKPACSLSRKRHVNNAARAGRLDMAAAAVSGQVPVFPADSFAGAQ